MPTPLFPDIAWKWIKNNNKEKQKKQCCIDIDEIYDHNPILHQLFPDKNTTFSTIEHHAHSLFDPVKDTCKITSL